MPVPASGRDSPHQQLTAEPWRRRRLVAPAPQFSKSANVELGEARERLLGDTVLSTRHSPSPLAGRFVTSEAIYGPVIGILASRRLATGFAQAGNGRPHGMRQPTKALPNFRDGSAFGSLQQADQLRALCAGWWFLGTAHSGRARIGALCYGFGV